MKCLARGVVVAALLCAHCSGETAKETKSLNVETHRASALACASTRGPGTHYNAGSVISLPGGCASDADCTEGKNGRCEAGRIGRCSYDTCGEDGDCGGSGVCECGTSGPAPSTSRTAHKCVTGNCRVDSDCASGFCSPSYDNGCGREGVVVGYFCHTPEDECTNANDGVCKERGFVDGTCAWSPTKSRWACETCAQ